MGECEAEKIGLKIGNTIFLLAGTKELVCKGCSIKCPYTEKDYAEIPDKYLDDGVESRLSHED